MMHGETWLIDMGAVMAAISRRNSLPLEFPGDPTVLGWVTTLGYLAAAACCAHAANRPRADPVGGLERRRRWFWYGLCCLLILLGINKQLDLQTMIQWLGRQIIEGGDWYKLRAALRVGFVVGICAAAGAMLLSFAWLTRGVWRDHGMALFGLALLVVFVVVRVAWFENMDDLVGLSLQAENARWVLELGGIACIGLSAVRHGRARRHTPKLSVP